MGSRPARDAATDEAQDRTQDEHRERAQEEAPDRAPDDLVRAAHRTIRRVTEDIEGMRFNTAISALMELGNRVAAQSSEVRPAAASTASPDMTAGFRFAVETMVQLLSPFAPHLAEELWQGLGHDGSVHEAPWPQWDPDLIEEDVREISVAVDGRRRAVMEVSPGTPGEEIERMARELPAVSRRLKGREVERVVVVPGRAVNFVTKP